MTRAQGKLTTLKSFALLGLIFLFSCSEKQAADQKKYSIYTMAKDNKEYIVQTDDLSAGAVSPNSQGALTYPKQIWYDLIVKDGFYYRLERRNHFFLKYKVENNHYTPVDSVQLPAMAYLDNYNWVHPDTLFLISFNRKLSRMDYTRINVNTMKFEAGTIPVTLPFAPFNSMSVGFTVRRKNDLLLGYSYHTINGPEHYSTSDTVYVAILTYPGLKFKKTLKDIRSAYPGGANTAQPNTFTDEHGDFYFLACPGIAMGNNPDKPTAIFRIKKEEENLDSTFFWNISESPIKNHAYGLWYIGNGKAIIRSERRDLFTGIEDHYKVPHVEFHVLDLKRKTLKKLDLPLDKGTSRQCVLAENGKVFISINSDTAGNFVWIYDPKNESLKKGLRIEGPVDYILRIEALYQDSK